jgi:hypothetical protein
MFYEHLFSLLRLLQLLRLLRFVATHEITARVMLKAIRSGQVDMFPLGYRGQSHGHCAVELDLT